MISIDPRRRDTWLFWITAVLVLGAGLLTIAAPWLMQVPALHGPLAALGCRGF